MQLLLARHGETGARYAGRYIGRTDLPLSERGREQARRLAQALPKRISRCLCSPLGRARETAGLALLGRDCPLEEWDALREVDFGRWEGLSFAEIVAQDQGLVDEWQLDPSSFRFPGGELTTDFRQRVQDALDRIIALPGEVLLVICHGGVIRSMVCSLLGLPFDHYLSFHIAPAALTVVEVDGKRGVLTGLNLGTGAAIRPGEG